MDGSEKDAARKRLLKAMIGWHDAEHGKRQHEVGLPVIDLGMYEFKTNPFKMGDHALVLETEAFQLKKNPFFIEGFEAMTDLGRATSKWIPGGGYYDPSGEYKPGGGWHKRGRSWQHTLPEGMVFGDLDDGIPDSEVVGAWPRQFDRFKLGEGFDLEGAAFAWGDDMGAPFGMNPRVFARLRQAAGRRKARLRKGRPSARNWYQQRAKQRGVAAKFMKRVKAGDFRAQAALKRIKMLADRGNIPARKALKDIAQIAICWQNSKMSGWPRTYQPFKLGASPHDGQSYANCIDELARLSGI